MTAGEILAKHLTRQEHAEISAKLEASEKGTYGEIIPVVVLQSRTWFAVPRLADLFVFSLLLCVCIVLGLEWEWILGCFFVAGAAGYLAHIFPQSLKFFTSVPDKRQAAQDRAELEFYRNHFDRSKKHATILIFLSLLERQIVVLIDPELSKKIPKADLDERVQKISSALAQELRKKDWKQGFCNAIEHSGELLKKYAPAPADYRHEFPAQIFVVGE